MGSTKLKDNNAKLMMESGKYARYTPEQVEVLERVYNGCQKPSSSRRQQLIRECPSLANIGQKQLKVWFQNKRYELNDIFTLFHNSFTMKFVKSMVSSMGTYVIAVRRILAMWSRRDLDTWIAYFPLCKAMQFFFLVRLAICDDLLPIASWPLMIFLFVLLVSNVV